MDMGPATSHLNQMLLMTADIVIPTFRPDYYGWKSYYLLLCTGEIVRFLSCCAHRPPLSFIADTNTLRQQKYCLLCLPHTGRPHALSKTNHLGTNGCQVLQSRPCEGIMVVSHSRGICYTALSILSVLGGAKHNQCILLFLQCLQATRSTHNTRGLALSGFSQASFNAVLPDMQKKFLRKARRILKDTSPADWAGRLYHGQSKTSNFEPPLPSFLPGLAQQFKVVRGKLSSVPVSCFSCKTTTCS